MVYMRRIASLLLWDKKTSMTDKVYSVLQSPTSLAILASLPQKIANRNQYMSFIQSGVLHIKIKAFPFGESGFCGRSKQKTREDLKSRF